MLGDACVHSTAQLAVAHTVEEINCQSDSKPDKESDPGHHWEAQHQSDEKDYTKDWKDRNKRHTKRTWTLRRNTAKYQFTPRQTRINANRVPILVRSARSPMFVTIETPPTTTPVQIVVICGVRNRG